LKQIRIYSDAKGACGLIDGFDSPSHQGRLLAVLTDLKGVADTVDPFQESALVHHSVEVVDFIQRLGSGPFRNRIRLTEGMTEFEDSGRRDSRPHVT
jgi:hypothetical protein